MTSTFSGFSEQDIERLKSEKNKSNNDVVFNANKAKKIEKIGAKQRNHNNFQYKSQIERNLTDVALENVSFAKCKLNVQTTPDILNNNIEQEDEKSYSDNEITEPNSTLTLHTKTSDIDDVKVSTESSVNCTNIKACNYTENEPATHAAKLEGLQLQQKLMEEQNKKRKEMLAKALADRTKQTEEEVIKLEKIKKELQVLDGQFSQDVSVLRKKIDQACLTYAEAEKTYLKVEKEFLQAKINLQKEKEKKELLTEHLCALITHNETRKAKKLETLMVQLVYDKSDDNIHDNENNTREEKSMVSRARNEDNDDGSVIVDGVDERTGKIVEFTS